MASLADVFVAVTGDLGPLRQAAQDGGAAAGQTAATGFRQRFEAGVAVAAAASGALLAAGLAGAIARSNTTGLLAAQVGAAGPEMAKLGRLSGELFASGYGASIEEVNDALRAVIQNGLAGLNSSEADIKRVASRVSDLATLLGEDAGRVSAAIQQMLRTGLAKTADEAFDLLTKATQNGINKSEDLLDTVNEYGVQFQKLGLDGPTALGLLSQAIQAGARDSDVAADAIKEFSIRSVDGSKAARDSFAALGLDADAMIKIFSEGGPKAKDAFDQVLDALSEAGGRADYATIAFGLFGTQSEDLGAALGAMNVDSAAADLGVFTGAAQRAGDTLAGSAGAQVEVFKRSIEQGLIDATAKAIPYLQAVFGWLVKNREIIVPVASVVGGLALAVWAVNTAMSVWAGITAAVNAVHLVAIARTVAHAVAVAANTAAIYVLRAAMLVWIGVQWLLNAALTANPIGLVVLAIAALVAGIVLAYKHSETFRNIVQGAWEAIKSASVAVWGFIKPIFEAWWAFAQRMGAVYLWLWREVVQPAMQGIGFAVQAAWTILQIVFALWRMYIMDIVVPAVGWLWDKAVKPIFGLIVNQIQFAWAAIKVVWDAIVFYISNVLVPGYQFLWNAIKTVWNGIASTISAVWNSAIKPVFDFIMGFITQTVPAAWRRGVDLIGFWWNALRDLAKAPVKFIIDTVINKGIVGTINHVARFVGVKELGEFHPAGFASGGQLPGYSDVDNMVAIGPGGEPLALAGGEWIINARQSRKHTHLLNAINSGTDGFADGGIIGAFTNPAGWVRDRIDGFINAVPGAGMLRDVIVGTGRKLVTSLIDWVKSKLSFGGGGAGPGFGAWPSSPGAQRGDSGVWRSIVALIRSTGPVSGSFGNAYRPGDPLWHGSGRAVDWMGFNQDALASFFMARRGQLLEFIHRTNRRDYAVTRGRDRGSFNNTLMEQHRNHIHVAMANGGLVARVFDSGGVWRPGEIGVNLGNRNELVVPEGMAVKLDRDTITELAHAIAGALTGGMVSARRLGRQYG